MDPALRQEIISILDDTNDMTIATVREDGYPQATTVSYVNDGFTILFWLRGGISESAKPRP
jgi:nitroimidazol reductase NimA-like FMN-containing flavoprotein (pyridoxamine 5'-phosphate oxidase superfamily)